jgi:hypothetical protein
MGTILWCHPSYELGPGRGLSRLIDVVDESGQLIERYDLMCSEIDNDVGPEFLQLIDRVESGKDDLIDADGNGWVAYITRDKVWFESLYNDGEGGAVTLAQYKLAVATYLRFLSDPERKPIEVDFPDT